MTLRRSSRVRLCESVIVSQGLINLTLYRFRTHDIYIYIATDENRFDLRTNHVTFGVNPTIYVYPLLGNHNYIYVLLQRALNMYVCNFIYDNSVYFIRPTTWWIYDFSMKLLCTCVMIPVQGRKRKTSKPWSILLYGSLNSRFYWSHWSTTLIVYKYIVLGGELRTYPV